MIEHGNLQIDNHLAVGTIDSWIIWNLTKGSAFVTDATNASRTMLFDIKNMCWSKELCDLFNVPMHALPTVVPSSGRCALSAHHSGIPKGIPISGIAGDQQAALFGQACFQKEAARTHTAQEVLC